MYIPYGQVLDADLFNWTAMCQRVKALSLLSILGLQLPLPTPLSSRLKNAVTGKLF